MNLAPKIHKETCEINWKKSSEEIYNFVRGLSPYPAAWTTLNGKIHKIYKIKITDQAGKTNSDKEYLTDNKTFLHHKTENGWVSIEELQMEGKKRMEVEEYLRGNKLFEYRG
jgi:methionyl-tRNA formyltransferase